MFRAEEVRCVGAQTFQHPLIKEYAASYIRTPNMIQGTFQNNIGRSGLRGSGFRM